MFKHEGEWGNVVGGLTKMKAVRKNYMETIENFEPSKKIVGTVEHT